jgi:RNA polymerase sigma-70 factor (ECF subfamily)
VVGDFDLLKRWRDGDREAGSELLARHFDSLYRFFRNKLGGDFDDLIQRTFLACVESVDRFRGEASFRSYMFTVARNELYHYFERLNRGRRMEVDLGTMSVAQLGSSPSSKAARREEEQLLLEALSQIPVDLQIALELFYWEGLTTAEIASVLGIPSGTAKSRLRRAREAVEAAMKKCAKTPAALASTLDRFEHWAVAVRAAVERHSDGDG